MAKPVQLPNGRHFRIQDDALAHFKAMLHRYNVGDDVTSADDISDLTALIEAYDKDLAPGGPTKAGTGIAGFSKQANKGTKWVTEGFHVHRTDETRIDFSYIDAVKSASRQPKR
jgi:hypothetical protein